MFTTHKIQGAGGAGGADSYWIALAGGTGSESGSQVAIDSAGNIVVTGDTNTYGAGSDDVLTIKYDKYGTLQWSKALGGTSADYGIGVAIDSSDNIITVSQTASDGAGGTDALIAKYNSSGTLQWDKTLGGSGFDSFYAVAVDSSGNIIAVGQTNSDGAGSSDGLIAKYNSSGTLQWDKTLGGSGDESFQGVAIDSSDNIIVVGHTASDGAGGYDALIAKYNSSGTLQWDKTLGGSGFDSFRSVAIDSSGDIVVVGNTNSDGAGSHDALIAKYNSSGVLQWDRTLGGTGIDYFRAVTIDSSDNIIAVGYTDSDGAGVQDALVAKYNSSGTLQWDKTLGGTGTDYCFGVTLDSSNNIIISGYTFSDGAGNDDMLVAKLPPDGSGDGTYGSLTYQDAVLTDAAAVLTDAAAVLTDAAAVLTDAAAVLTDQSVTLTEELFEVTP